MRGLEGHNGDAGCADPDPRWWSDVQASRSENKNCQVGGGQAFAVSEADLYGLHDDDGADDDGADDDAAEIRVDDR